MMSVMDEFWIMDYSEHCCEKWLVKWSRIDEVRILLLRYKTEVAGTLWFNLNRCTYCSSKDHVMLVSETQSCVLICFQKLCLMRRCYIWLGRVGALPGSHSVSEGNPCCKKVIAMRFREQNSASWIYTTQLQSTTEDKDLRTVLTLIFV